MNESNYKRIVWIVAVVVVVSLAIAGVTLRSGGVFSISSVFRSGGFTDVDEEKRYPASALNIVTFSTSADIRLHESSGEEIRFHLHGRVGRMRGGEATQLIERSVGERLEVGSEPPKRLIQITTGNLVLDVYIPRDYVGGVSIDSVSGDIDVPFGAFREVSIQSTSGDIRASELTSSSITIGSTSGDIRIDESHTAELTIDTTSGDIKFEGGADTVNADTTSGDISLELESVGGEMSVESTSGDVTLVVPSSAAFDLNATSTSGDIDSELPITIDGSRRSRGRGDSLEGVVGAGGPAVEIRTVSGDIRLQF